MAEGAMGLTGPILADQRLFKHKPRTQRMIGAAPARRDRSEGTHLIVRDRLV